MKYSKEMQAKIDELALKKENILYLPIAWAHLDRILQGTKTVEFRDLTNFYLGKLAVFKGDEFIERKPLTHVLLQAGYSLNVPRALIEMTDWCAILAFNEDGTVIEKSTRDDGELHVINEAVKEGFPDDAEYIGIALGKVVFTENLK